MLTSTRTLLATLAVAATTVAACSANAAGPSGVASLESASPGSEASAEPSAALDREAAALAFAECMRENGIDMPDPEVNGQGGVGIAIGGDKVNEEEMEAAMDACDHFLEDAAGERRELDPEMLDRMVEFASCMREHGIDMPDPTTDGGRIIVRGEASSGDGQGPQTRGDFFGADPDSQEFQEAEEACRPILGEFAPDGGPRVQSAPEPAKP
jgi:hypothetical protein